MVSSQIFFTVLIDNLKIREKVKVKILFFRKWVLSNQRPVFLRLKPIHQSTSFHTVQYALEQIILPLDTFILNSIK